MTLDGILTLIAEYKYETNPVRAGHLYRDITEHVKLLVLDKCRAIDKLDAYMQGRLK